MSLDRVKNDTFTFRFTTRAFATGIPTVLAGSPVLSAMEDAVDTPITTGVSFTASSVAGLNLCTIDSSQADFESGKEYDVYLSAGTVDSVSVIGEVVGHFSLSREASAVDLANGTDGLGAIKAETALILADTDDIGVAGAGLTDLGGMSTGMKAEVEVEVTDAIEALGLDPLINTTIATVNSQTDFDLTADSGDDDSYVDGVAVFQDVSTAAQKSFRRILTHTTSPNKNITIDAAPDFTIAATDKIRIFAAGVTPTAAGIADAVQDEPIEDHDTQGTVGWATALGVYAGSDGPGIYVDSGAANTNTVVGTDGTEINPVSTFAAARTLADALGLKIYYLEGNSDVTLAATHVDWEFIGLGSVMDNIVNLGSQDVSRSLFRNLTVEGTQGGAGRITARDCALQDPGAGDTTLHIFAERCGFVDRIQVDTSADNVFDQCYSLVAGTSAPVIQATGASGTISVRHYSGGMEFETLSASHNVTWEGIGQVIFNADCNVNANVSVRGVGSITDNTAGMSSLTETSLVNMTKINTEADTALSDYDGPTNAEMEARTLVAASYFDPTAQLTESYAANGVAPTTVQLQFALHQMLMQFGIAGTSLTVRKLDDSTTAFVVTLDDATSPTDAKRV